MQAPVAVVGRGWLASSGQLVGDERLDVLTLELASEEWLAVGLAVDSEQPDRVGVGLDGPGALVLSSVRRKPAASVWSVVRRTRAARRRPLGRDPARELERESESGESVPSRTGDEGPGWERSGDGLASGMVPHS